MVRGDVREDADLVRLVAHAAQDEPAAGRLEDGDVEVAPAEDLPAPPGPVQSPGSTIRSSTRTPSDVVVPTRRSASSRMCVISRVTVLLPLVPLIEMIGIRRSASRIHAGGVARASAIVASQRAIARDVDGPWRAARDGATSRSASSTAASAIECARSGPVHGNATIQCPGSVDRWTATPPRVLAVVDTESADPVDDPLDRGRPVASRNGRAQSDDRVSARFALAEPGRRRPIATSTLTTGASR